MFQCCSTVAALATGRSEESDEASSVKAGNAERRCIATILANILEGEVMMSRQEEVLTTACDEGGKCSEEEAQVRCLNRWCRPF